MKPEILYNRPTGIWFMIAYMELEKTAAAAGLAAEYVYNCNCLKNGRWIITQIKDKGQELVSGGEIYGRENYCKMRKYAPSRFRPKIEESCWRELYLAFVQRLTELCLAGNKMLRPCAIYEILEAAAVANVSLWNLRHEELEQRVSDPSLLSGIEKCIFQGTCPVSACRALFLIDRMHERSGGCTPHFVLLCGLKWLQHALPGDGYYAVPNGFNDQMYQDSCLLSRLRCADWRMGLFQHWDPDSRSREWEEKAVDTPVGAAFALATIIQHYAQSLQPGAQRALRHICSEALFLCASLKFLLFPNVESYRHAVSCWNSRTMSLVYNPEKLLEKVFRSEWGKIQLPTKKKCKTATAVFPRLLEQRVSLALDRHHFTSAISLCKDAGKSGAVWNALGPCLELLEFVSACLHLFKALVKAPQFAVEDLSTVTLHALVSLNWFDICGCMFKVSHPIVFAFLYSA